MLGVWERERLEALEGLAREVLADWEVHRLGERRIGIGRKGALYGDLLEAEGALYRAMRGLPTAGPDWVVRERVERFWDEEGGYLIITIL